MSASHQTGADWACSHASGWTRGRSTAARPPRRATSAGIGCDRNSGIDSVNPYAPTSRTATRSPSSGGGKHDLGREDVQARAQRTGDGHRHEAGAALGAGAEPPNAVLLADEDRAEDVMDPAVEDDDVPPADALPIDDTRHVGACRADEEAAGLDEDRGIAHLGVTRP